MLLIESDIPINNMVLSIKTAATNIRSMFICNEPILICNDVKRNDTSDQSNAPVIAASSPINGKFASTIINLQKTECKNTHYFLI